MCAVSLIDNKQQQNEVRFKWTGTGPCSMSFSRESLAVGHATHNTLSALKELLSSVRGREVWLRNDVSRWLLPFVFFQLYYFPFASDNNNSNNKEERKRERKKKIKIVPFHAIVNLQHLIEPSSNRLRLTKKSVCVFPTRRPIGYTISVSIALLFFFLFSSSFFSFLFFSFLSCSL